MTDFKPFSSRALWKLVIMVPHLTIFFLGIVWVCPLTVSSGSSSLMKDPYWKSLLLNPLKEYHSHEDNLNNQSSIRQYFQPDELHTMNTMVTEFLQYPDEVMWKQVTNVSLDHPFILFHQRKAGGSSLRDTLFDAARKLRLPQYIPCKFRDCDIYTFPRDHLYSIYAGHFKWGAQSDLAKFNKTRRSHFSCATNYRHPISRIESCLYFRFGKTFDGQCLYEFDLEKFHNLLLSVDEFGTSCLNEPFRALSGYSDELILDHLMDGVHADSERRLYHPEHIIKDSSSTDQQLSSGRRLLDTSALNVFNMTLQHTLKCTPIVLEFPESYDLMSSRIPMLGNAGGFKSTVWIQVGSKTKKTCGHLKGEQLQLAERYAALEIMLYDAVLRKVLRRIADTDPNFLFHIKCRDSSPPRDYIPFEETKGPPMALVATNGVQVVQIRTLIEYALGYYTGTIRARREYMSMFPAEQYCGKRMVSIFAEVSVFKVRGDPKNNYNAILEYFLSASKKRCHHGMIPHFKRASIITQDPFFEIWKALNKAPNRTEASFLQVLSQFEVKKLKRIPEDKLSIKEKRRRLTSPFSIGHHQHHQHHHQQRPFNLRHADSLPQKSTTNEPTQSFPSPSPEGDGNAGVVEQDKSDATINTDTSVNDIVPPPKLQAQEEEDEEKMSQQQQLQKGAKDDSDFGNATSSNLKNTTATDNLITGAVLEYQFYHDYFDLFLDWYSYSWLFPDYYDVYRSYVNTTQAKIDGLDKVEFKHLLELITSRHGKTLPRFNNSNFLFISYDAILESAVEISTDTMTHTTFTNGGLTLKYNGTFSYTPANNAMMRLLQETGYHERMKTSAVQCAFSHVQSASDQWMTSEKLKQIRSMRVFYAKYPRILNEVKALMRRKLKDVMLLPQQTRFLYSLNEDQ